MAVAVAALASYAIGMFPTALMVGRRIGRQPTSEGSGNPGASNMYRIGGLKAGSAVAIVDTAKGALPTLVALVLWGRNEALAAWLGATVGHVWPVLGLLPGLGKLRGGKGVATAGGGALVLEALLASISLAVFVAVLFWRRVAALASLGALAAYLVLIIVLGSPLWDAAVAAAVAVIVVWRHRPNIARMRRGAELSVQEDGEARR